MLFKLSDESTVEILPFADFTELAKLTEPYIETGRVAISGGSTYDKLFEAWAAAKATIKGTTILPVDERVVPIEDPQSNWGNLCRKLLEPLGAEDKAIHGATSVAEYNHLLHTIFHSRFPRFDAIFLGVGDDGHTASLFPNDPAVENLHEWVLKTESPKGVKDRITLSSKVIMEAEKCICVIAGDDKEWLLEALAERKESLPFISVLAKRDISTLYLPQKFFESFEKLVS